MLDSHRSQTARRRFRAGAILLLLACLPGCKAGPPPPSDSEPDAVERLPPRTSIVLITVDTLRADHLSSYGYPRQTSPNIDRLAAEGVRFDQASSQWPKTTPSFASLFTSTYPKDNGNVRKVGIPLPCRAETVAEVLQRQGYATYAVVSNSAVASELNFNKGFDQFVETWKLNENARGGDPNRAEAVTNIATRLIERIDRKRPFFLWVHYLDPHWPYSSPRDWARRFDGDRFYHPSPRIPIARGKKRQEMLGIGEGQVQEGHDDLAHYVARYDAAIAYTDAQIGRLLTALRAHGLLASTLTAFTADHGESLGEHGYYFDHGRFGFQTCLRVPLILHDPGVLAPHVDSAPVELIDLSPTFVEATGVPLAGGVWMQGQTLTPRLRGSAVRRAARPAPEPGAHAGYAFSEAGIEQDHRWEKIVRDERFKLIYAQMLSDQRWLGGEGVRFVLYDLRADPGELHNVAASFPVDLQRLKLALSLWEHAPPFTVETEAPTEGCGEQRALDPRSEALLKSLGYL